jgi:transposase
MGKRTFTREFKLQAVRMVKERSLAKAQVARDISVHANVLKNWLDQHDADPQGAFGGTSAKTLEIAQIEQVNSPPAKAGGFGDTAQAGYGRPAADSRPHTTLKLSSGTSGF